MSDQRGWMRVKDAATFLAVTEVALRRSLDKNARRTADGATVSHLDGVTARKLGRQWRVWLDASWKQPQAPR
jgi:hypothetical protein